MLAPFPQGSTNSAAAFTACVAAGLSATPKHPMTLPTIVLPRQSMSHDDTKPRPFHEVAVNGVK
jgi:hypothetical protein